MLSSPSFGAVISGPFEVCSLARLRQPAHADSSSSALSGYAVVLITDCTSAADQSSPGLDGGRVYFSGPGQLGPVLAQVPALAQGQVLRFADSFLCASSSNNELLLGLFHHKPARELLLPAEQAAELRFLLASIQQAAGPLREALLQVYVQALLLRCASYCWPQAPIAYPPRTQPGLFLRFRQLLEQYYTKWKSVAVYADQLCVTPNHLSVSVKKTGLSASNHIRQRIMLEAQRLVAARDASLKEIAYELGFDDVAHFSKLFKRCHGISFSSFRAQARQQYEFSTSLAVA